MRFSIIFLFEKIIVSYYYIIYKLLIINVLSYLRVFILFIVECEEFALPRIEENVSITGFSEKYNFSFYLGFGEKGRFLTSAIFWVSNTLIIKHLTTIILKNRRMTHEST